MSYQLTTQHTVFDTYVKYNFNWSIDSIFWFAGKARGVLYEDDGDGYEYTKGGYLLTTYVAELQSSVVSIRVSKTEGLWKRPKRCLHVHLLLGKGALVCIMPV